MSYALVEHHLNLARKEVNKLNKLLYEVCILLESNGLLGTEDEKDRYVSDEFFDWYLKDQEIDKKRKQREKEEKRRQEIMKKALKKLTDEEREVLDL